MLAVNRRCDAQVRCDTAHQFRVAFVTVEEFRDEELAVQAAANAIRLAGNATFEFYDTMAAAYATSGDFEQAVGYATKAIEMAPPAYAPALRLRLAQYEMQKPFREELEAATERTAEEGADPDAATRR